MRQILMILMITMVLSSNLISAGGIHNEDDEDHKELNLWEKIIKWFKNIFSSTGDSDNSSNILEDFEGNAEFHKSMSCGCCGIHSNYIKNKGLDFKIINMDDVSPIKEKYGVPTELYSCHTIILGDYFIEGHMPIEAIKKLITEKPDIAGITLPEMPPGTPGMPGTKDGEWIIYSVNHDGSYDEFMRI